MLGFVRGVLHPEGYHGLRRRGTWFEGWYVKATAPTGRTLVCIPGVFLGGDDPHAFVQIADTATGRMDLHRFEVADFDAALDRFDVRIGPNRFTSEGMDLDLPHDRHPLHGGLDFGPLAPWPVRWTAPGCMGWYGWVPVLECYHGILSFGHEVRGRIALGGEEVSFDGGRGYVEKDWGRRFPSSWVWAQSHFEDGASVSLSVARVPWLKGSFPGFLGGARLADGEQVRFATWTGARLADIEVSDGSARVVLEDDRHRLEVTATRDVPVVLFGPSERAMDRTVVEGMAGPVTARLVDLASGKTRLEATSDLGSVEIHGEEEELAALAIPGWRRQFAPEE